MVELRSLKTLIIIKKRAVHVAKTLQNLVQCFWGRVPNLNQSEGKNSAFYILIG